MYEQYTDEQIVKMLKPKLTKILGDGMWDTALEHSEGGRNLIELIATIYRSAYIRGRLGRSFIIGEKKTREKKIKESVNTFKAGDKVKFLGLNMEDEEAWVNKQFFPPVNTVSKVVKSGLIYCVVHWPRSTTSGDWMWSCRNSYLEKITEHWVPATKDNIEVGSKVKMIDEGSHKSKPWRFPDVGTVGTVTEVNIHTPLVQWPKGSTSRTDEWYCDDTRLEVLLCE